MEQSCQYNNNPWLSISKACMSAPKYQEMLDQFGQGSQQAPMWNFLNPNRTRPRVAYRGTSPRFRGTGRGPKPEKLYDERK